MKKLSKFTLTSIIFLLLIAIIATPLRIVLQNVSATTAYPYQTSLISNGTFSGYTGSEQPFTPGTWSVLNPNGETDVIAGVISTNTAGSNTAESNWKPDKLGLENEDNPGQPHSNLGSSSAEYLNLFINAESDSIYYGYKSNSFTLAANSYYEISVFLTTINGAHASVIVDGLSATAKIENISTGGTVWPEYSIFIQTGTSSETVSLQLMLGNLDANSTGAVFFNSATVWQHSATSYAAQKPNVSTITQLVVDLKNEAPTTYIPFVNAGFDEDSEEEGILNWAIETATEGVTFADIVVALANTQQYNNIKSPNLVENTHILYLNNSSDAWQKITSSAFTIPANSFLKLAFWAKTNISGGNFSLINNLDESVGQVSIGTSAGADANNGWSQYDIVIEGGVTPTELYIRLDFGTEASPVTGYLGIDNVTLQKISYKSYSDGGDAKVVLKADGRTDSFAVKNGTFSKTANENYEVSHPLTPYSWTYFASDDREELAGTHGVVNTNSNLFTHPLGSSYIMTNPNTFTGDMATVYNNVLMIYNESVDTQYYQSSSTLQLSANTYYELSFYVNSIGLGSAAEGAYIKLYSSTAEYFYIKNIDTAGEWGKYTVHIYTGNNSLTCNVDLGMVNNGVAFFDNVIMKSSTGALFSGAEETSKIFRVNLQNENFSIRVIDAKGENVNSLYTATTWTMNTKGGTTPTYGILDVNDNTQKTAIGLSDLAQINSKNVFVIKAVLDTYFSSTSKNVISLTAGSYYKITISLLTKNLSSISEAEKYGAFVGLSGFDNVLGNISTNGEYQEFVIYVTTDTDKTSAVTFGLGATNAICAGTVICEQITIETSDEASYTSALTGTNTLKLESVTEEDDDNETPEDETGDEKRKLDPATLWAIIPSAIFGIVIIVVVIIMFWKKSKFAKKIKNKVTKAKVPTKATYDRKNTQTNKTALNIKDKINLYEKEIIAIKVKMVKLEEELGKIETQHQDKVAEIKEEHKNILKAKKENLAALIASREKSVNDFKSKTASATEQKEFKRYLATTDKNITVEKRFIETAQPDVKQEKRAYETKKAEKRADINALESKVTNLNNEISKLKLLLKERSALNRK